MEGVCLFSKEEAEAAGCTMEELAERELKKTLEGLAQHLFGDRPGPDSGSVFCGSATLLGVRMSDSCVLSCQGMWRCAGLTHTSRSPILHSSWRSSSRANGSRFAQARTMEYPVS